MRVDRRTALKAGAAFAATALTSGCVTSPSSGRSAGRNLPQRGEFVVRGATVLTMDPAIGDFATGDVHVRDGVIVSVAPNISAAQGSFVDGRGTICMPGFIDTHWHLWTSVCRAMIQLDDPKRSYFPVTNAVGRHFTPEDSYRSVRLGAAEALHAGATTVHDWAHNIRSPEHADAELRAMRDVGVRGRLAYGTPQGYPDEKPMDLEGLARIQRQWMPNDGLLTLGICSRNVGDTTNKLRGNISVDTARIDWGGARALKLPITMHTSGPSPVKLLEDAKLLGPDVQLVHPMLTTAEERRIMRDARRELQHVTHRRNGTAGERRCDSVGRAARSRREGEHLDRQHEQLRRRLFPVHAHPLSPAHASHRAAHSARLQTPGASRHDRRGHRPRHRGPHRLAYARQAGRSHPRAHRRDQRGAHERSRIRRSFRSLNRATSTWSSSTAAFSGEAARSPRSTMARSSGKPPSARRRCARVRTGRDDASIRHSCDKVHPDRSRSATRSGAGIQAWIPASRRDDEQSESSGCDPRASSSRSSSRAWSTSRYPT